MLNHDQWLFLNSADSSWNNSISIFNVLRLPSNVYCNFPEFSIIWLLPNHFNTVFRCDCKFLITFPAVSLQKYCCHQQSYKQLTLNLMSNRSFKEEKPKYKTLWNSNNSLHPWTKDHLKFYSLVSISKVTSYWS